MSAPLAVRLRVAAAGLHADRTNLQHLVDAHGAQGRAALLVLLGVLSICPAPGVGTLAGVATLALGNLFLGLALAFAGVGIMRRDGLAWILAAACGLLGTARLSALALLSPSALDGLAALANDS